jgi:hypothetical protein
LPVFGLNFISEGERGSPLLVVTGEVDVATSPALRQEIVGLLDSGTDRVRRGLERGRVHRCFGNLRAARNGRRGARARRGAGVAKPQPAGSPAPRPVPARRTPPGRVRLALVRRPERSDDQPAWPGWPSLPRSVEPFLAARSTISAAISRSLRFSRCDARTRSWNASSGLRPPPAMRMPTA